MVVGWLFASISATLVVMDERGYRYRWTVSKQGESCFEDREVSVNTAVAQVENHRLPDLVLRVLAGRGINEASDIDHLFNATLHDLHDATLLPGVVDAATRIVEAFTNDEAIAIYGDYDVDGLTASAILYHIFKLAKPDSPPRIYIPHRLEEGYGLNADALRTLKSEGVSVVVTVDCGITAIHEAEVAKEIGLDLIITDHHNPPAEAEPVPDAFALVHPRLQGSQYPFGDLCGAGVAFKLAWHIAKLWCGSERVSDIFKSKLLECLALTAMGTIADIVPLVGENRVIAKYGLKMIRNTTIPGLNALIEVSGLKKDDIVDAEAVGFRLGPRLNAAGRMGHAKDAARLLTDADAEEASSIAQYLDSLNRERQNTERLTSEEAAQLAEDKGMTGDGKPAIVLADPGWHPGVVGIVCSRLVSRFGRPTILLQEQGDICRGSGRSIDGFMLHDALDACKAHLTTFGGHDMAAGLSLETKNLQAFTDAFTAWAGDHLDEALLTPGIEIDCESDICELDIGTIRSLMKLGPFGRMNPLPRLLIRNARVSTPPRLMGHGGKHLAIHLESSNAISQGKTQGIRCIGWGLGMGSIGDRLTSGMLIDVVLEPRLSTWQGREKVEPLIQDIRVIDR